MTLRTGVLILVPALFGLVADALCPGTDETGMRLRAGVLILVPALFGLAAVACALVLVLVPARPR
ncbi:hypothetical protein [Streptomyces bauhiniae]|uniref:Uncharacterized protein n=1 Tax=Streptomyces bauhiniae TaxID=2340725 RepID=A0A7K3QTH4_9ACTN|nr:hypothetical protein [Streptomyces bauhiniae]NEB93192.1 hypothetical protein [Streptomyces bauhiniae]